MNTWDIRRFIGQKNAKKRPTLRHPNNLQKTNGLPCAFFQDPNNYMKLSGLEKGQDTRIEGRGNASSLALQGRNLIAGGNAPGNRQIYARPRRGRTNSGRDGANLVRLRGIDPFKVGTSVGRAFRGRCPRLLYASPAGIIRLASFLPRRENTTKKGAVLRIPNHPSPLKSSALPPVAWRAGRRGPRL